MHERGQGVPADPAEAVAWYRRAALQGDVHAQFRLGFLYAYGRGVDRDDLQAADWYGRAAARGNRAAQAALDELRAEGRLPTPGGSRDTLLLRSAADRGGATAQYQLGVRYATGEGVARDPAQAYQWFSVAARSLLGKEADTARQARDSVKAQLSPEQLARGEELVRSWRAKPEATSAPVATPRR